MLTALLIVLAVLFTVGIAFTLVGLAQGCPFAWLSVVCGGLGTLVEALIACVSGILDQ